MTPNAEKTQRLLKEFFPELRYGVYSRRRIRRSWRWSQHSWPNALDLFFTSNAGDSSAAHQAQLDVVHAFLVARKKQLGINNILWRVRDHDDHIHIDFWPAGTGTPPTVRGGAAGKYIYEDKRVVSTATLLKEAKEKEMEKAFWTFLTKSRLIEGDPSYYYSGKATDQEVDHALTVAAQNVVGQSGVGAGAVALARINRVAELLKHI